jgi:hypothetical protein
LWVYCLINSSLLLTRRLSLTRNGTLSYLLFFLLCLA